MCVVHPTGQLGLASSATEQPQDKSGQRQAVSEKLEQESTSQENDQKQKENGGDKSKTGQKRGHQRQDKTGQNSTSKDSSRCGQSKMDEKGEKREMREKNWVQQN